jgi:hypothetical protein
LALGVEPPEPWMWKDPPGGAWGMDFGTHM